MFAFYFESKRERNIDIDNSFEKFMGSIKYLDIEYSKTIWIHFVPDDAGLFHRYEGAKIYFICY